MATRKVPGVLASFVHIDAACGAITSLRGQGRRDFTVYSAAPNHELEEALGITSSPVRLFTLFGGLIGCTAGFGMTIWMSRDWPLLVGGKPIAPIPPYVVMAFELTVLIGALSTVAGMMFLAARDTPRGLAYHPSFSDDRIGIFVPAGGDQAGAVAELLRGAGATEVRHEA
jgi:hypothetical protein